ncbi:MAG TPA: RNA polymerase sigma factor [Ktedonobacterales bacterium]
MAIAGLGRYFPARRGVGWFARSLGRLALAASAQTNKGHQRDGHAEPARTRPTATGAPNPDFEAFFREHERAVYACLWRLTGDPQTARDLTQETFVRAWRHFEQIRGYEQPRAWLVKVATNQARSSHRSAHLRTISTDALPDSEAPARSDPTQRLAERDLVQRTLLELPLAQRTALTLREVYGFSCAEIAETLGISRDAAKMALFRGRESFRRRYLGKEAGDER